MCLGTLSNKVRRGDVREESTWEDGEGKAVRKGRGRRRKEEFYFLFLFERNLMDQSARAPKYFYFLLSITRRPDEA